MSKIGNLGKRIIFETSDKKILNFSNFKRTVSGRWTVHNSIGGKQGTEFLGPGLDKNTFTVVLSATHGIKPRKTLEAIEKAVKTGEVNKLVVGGKSVGDGKYRITSVSESWDCIYQKGELSQATLNITLEEYA